MLKTKRNYALIPERIKCSFLDFNIYPRDCFKILDLLTSTTDPFSFNSLFEIQANPIINNVFDSYMENSYPEVLKKSKSSIEQICDNFILDKQKSKALSTKINRFLRFPHSQQEDLLDCDKIAYFCFAIITVVWISIGSNNLFEFTRKNYHDTIFRMIEKSQIIYFLEKDEVKSEALGIQLAPDVGRSLGEAFQHSTELNLQYSGLAIGGATIGLPQLMMGLAIAFGIDYAANMAEETLKTIEKDKLPKQWLHDQVFSFKTENIAITSETLLGMGAVYDNTCVQRECTLYVPVSPITGLPYSYVFVPSPGDEKIDKGFVQSIELILVEGSQPQFRTKTHMTKSTEGKIPISELDDKKRYLKLEYHPLLVKMFNFEKIDSDTKISAFVSDINADLYKSKISKFILNLNQRHFESTGKGETPFSTDFIPIFLKDLAAKEIIVKRLYDSPTDWNCQAVTREANISHLIAKRISYNGVDIDVTWNEFVDILNDLDDYIGTNIRSDLKNSVSSFLAEFQTAIKEAEDILGKETNPKDIKRRIEVSKARWAPTLGKKLYKELLIKAIENSTGDQHTKKFLEFIENIKESRLIPWPLSSPIYLNVNPKLAKTTVDYDSLASQMKEELFAELGLGTPAKRETSPLNSMPYEIKPLQGRYQITFKKFSEMNPEEQKKFEEKWKIPRSLIIKSEGIKVPEDISTKQLFTISETDKKIKSFKHIIDELKTSNNRFVEANALRMEISEFMKNLEDSHVIIEINKILKEVEYIVEVSKLEILAQQTREKSEELEREKKELEAEKDHRGIAEIEKKIFDLASELKDDLENIEEQMVDIRLRVEQLPLDDNSRDIITERLQSVIEADSIKREKGIYEKIQEMYNKALSFTMELIENKTEPDSSLIDLVETSENYLEEVKQRVDDQNEIISRNKIQTDKQIEDLKLLLIAQLEDTNGGIFKELEEIRDTVTTSSESILKRITALEEQTFPVEIPELKNPKVADFLAVVKRLDPSKTMAMLNIIQNEFNYDINKLNGFMMKMLTQPTLIAEMEAGMINKNNENFVLDSIKNMDVMQNQLSMLDKNKVLLSVLLTHDQDAINLNIPDYLSNNLRLMYTTGKEMTYALEPKRVLLNFLQENISDINQWFDSEPYFSEKFNTLASSWKSSVEKYGPLSGTIDLLAKNKAKIPIFELITKDMGEILKKEIKGAPFKNLFHLLENLKSVNSEKHSKFFLFSEYSAYYIKLIEPNPKINDFIKFAEHVEDKETGDLLSDLTGNEFEEVVRDLFLNKENYSFEHQVKSFIPKLREKVNKREGFLSDQMRIMIKQSSEAIQRSVDIFSVLGSTRHSSVGMSAFLHSALEYSANKNQAKNFQSSLISVGSILSVISLGAHITPFLMKHMASKGSVSEIKSEKELRFFKSVSLALLPLGQPSEKIINYLEDSLKTFNFNINKNVNLDVLLVYLFKETNMDKKSEIIKKIYSLMKKMASGEISIKFNNEVTSLILETFTVHSKEEVSGSFEYYVQAFASAIKETDGNFLIVDDKPYIGKSPANQVKNLEDAQTVLENQKNIIIGNIKIQRESNTRILGIYQELILKIQIILEAIKNFPRFMDLNKLDDKNFDGEDIDLKIEDDYFSNYIKNPGKSSGLFKSLLLKVYKRSLCSSEKLDIIDTQNLSISIIRQLMGEQLKPNMFLHDYWENTINLLPLLSNK